MSFTGINYWAVVMAAVAAWMVGAFVMAWMLAGIMGHLGDLTVKAGVISGAFCWFGFTIPAIVVNYVFARRSPLLIVIDGGYWLIALATMGAIIGGLGLR